MDNVADPAPPLGRRPELDGLRGLAAYIVVVSHVSNATGLWGKALGQGGGQLGVMLFFVLSGFLMGSLYLDRPFTLRTVGVYALHRATRIVPLYYAVVLLALATASNPSLSVYPVSQANLFDHLAFINGVSVFWTIPVEVRFYAFFVALWAVYAVWKPGLPLILAAGIALSLLFEWDRGTAPMTFAFCAAFFLSGVAVSRVQWPRSPIAWSIAFLGAMALLIAIYPQLYAQTFGHYRWATNGDVWRMWRDPIYLIATVAVLVAAINAPLARLILGSPPLRWAGSISFSVYLLHQPVIDLLARYSDLERYPVPFLGATLALATLIAGVTYVLWESPWRSRLNALVAPKTGRDAA